MAVPAPASAQSSTVATYIRTQAAGTPGKLRFAAVFSVVACLVFGVVAATSIGNRHDAIGDARVHAAQLVLVQSVRSGLVEADAYATNAFLVGGLEPRATREAYEKAIASSAAGLAEAAAAGGDTSEFATIAAALSRYTGLVESARANNRQGFPVGVAYLKQASGLLQTEMLPLFDQLVARTTDRVDEAYRSAEAANSPVWSTGFVALVVLAVTQLFLAKKTRRTLNPSLVVATAAVAGSLLIAGSLSAYAQNRAENIRDGAYSEARNLAAARAAAFDAKSAESLTLISRGSGAVYEERFAASIAEASASIGNTPDQLLFAEALGAYLDTHETIRELDNSGQWDRAVEIATADASGVTQTGQGQFANAKFATFDTRTAEALASATETVADELEAVGGQFAAAVVVIVLAAVVAAFASWRGLSLRLREYR